MKKGYLKETLGILVSMLALMMVGFYIVGLEEDNQKLRTMYIDLRKQALAAGVVGDRP